MLIDDTHKKWVVATLVIMGGSTAVYIPYALTAPNGPSGGSWMGLTFGIVGYAFMVYAGLLMGRKKKPVWRVGRTQTWMRGHLWLGFASLLLILYHAGFAFGGVLTWTLMMLFIIVWVSGLFGALLHHYLPRLMTVEVPMETIFEQIEHVRAKLREEADHLVAAGVDGQGPADRVLLREERIGDVRADDADASGVRDVGLGDEAAVLGEMDVGLRVVRASAAA